MESSWEKLSDDYRKFLKLYDELIEESPGDVLDVNGDVIDGLVFMSKKLGMAIGEMSLSASFARMRKCSECKASIMSIELELVGIEMKSPNDQDKKEQYTRMYQQKVAHLKSVVLEPIIKDVVGEADISVIPIEFFEAVPTLGEEILTAYQVLKTEELQALPAGQDCTPLVEEVKATVEEMNKTFNNIERTRDTKENFADLFQRDKTL